MSRDPLLPSPPLPDEENVAHTPVPVPPLSQHIPHASRWLISAFGRLWSKLIAGRDEDVGKKTNQKADGHPHDDQEDVVDEEGGGVDGKQRLSFGLTGEAAKAAKVSVRNLERTVEELQILKGVSMEMEKGIVTGIIGPSGSGKSTLLRALNRLWEPHPATVFLDGLDITSLNVLDVRRRVGMLFQTPALFEGTVADNVRYGPSLAGIKLDDSQVEAFLQIAALDASFASKGVNGLSVGEAQRVALARTLANNPEVLLLDEPTSALDPISTGKIENAVRELSKKGLTIIIVSHSIKQIQNITTLVCVLVKGELVERLPPNELKNSNHPLIRQFLEAS